MENVQIRGRGIIYRAYRGVEVNFSKNVTIDGITVINPRHYTAHAGQSRDLTIKNLKSISCDKWSDGIDMMSCSNVLIDRAFLRTSDDSIAVYAYRRGKYYGDKKNVSRSGTRPYGRTWPTREHGHARQSRQTRGIREDLVFENIDILNHDEPQIGYQG